jgi:hypothetical protein
MSFFNNFNESVGHKYHYSLLKNEDDVTNYNEELKDDFVTDINESEAIYTEATQSSLIAKTDKSKYHTDDVDFHHENDKQSKLMDKYFKSYGYDSPIEWWLKSGIRAKYAENMK